MAATATPTTRTTTADRPNHCRRRRRRPSESTGWRATRCGAGTWPATRTRRLGQAPGCIRARSVGSSLKPASRCARDATRSPCYATEGLTIAELASRPRVPHTSARARRRADRTPPADQHHTPRGHAAPLRNRPTPRRSTTRPPLRDTANRLGASIPRVREVFGRLGELRQPSTQQRSIVSGSPAATPTAPPSPNSVQRSTSHPTRSPSPSKPSSCPTGHQRRADRSPSAIGNSPLSSPPATATSTSPHATTSPCRRGRLESLYPGC